MVFQKKRIKVLLSILAALLAGIVIWYQAPTIYRKITHADQLALDPHNSNVTKNIVTTQSATESTIPFPVTHIKTPDSVKAVYMSSWTAGSPKYRDPVLAMIDTTDLNAVVIDIKDSTGHIGFHVANQVLEKYGSAEKRIPNIRELTSLLHQKNIYIIGRVSVFQDPYMTKVRPEWAITRKSDGKVWTDHKGLSFLDPANKAVQEYIVMIARDAYDEGFDEINFDYIRYPSDGNIKDINYHLGQGRTRADNLEAFFKYLSREVKKDTTIPMSADLFGLTTEATDDMGIGQVWEKALPYFDFLSPMVYPSHYPPGQDGFKNPSAHPYEIITKALQGAIKKTTLVKSDIHKIRPWLQDFNLGAMYTKDLVGLEMKAVTDLGLHSWMIWDPNNKYTSSGGVLKIKTVN